MLPFLTAGLRAILAGAGRYVSSSGFIKNIFSSGVEDVIEEMSPGGSGGSGTGGRGEREYDDNESLRLAQAFERILKQHLRTNIFKTAKNSPFTQVVKGGNRPLNETGDLGNFVEIKKKSLGYTVGFNLEDTHTNNMSIPDLLNVLEYGKNLTNGNEVKRKAIGKYIWYKLNENGITSDNIGFGRKKKKGRPKIPKADIIIPPRPFFNRLVKDFTSKNKRSNVELTQGNYFLSIVVYSRGRS